MGWKWDAVLWDQDGVWLQNDGRQRFAARAVADAPTHLVSLAVGQFDGGGLPDLAAGGMHVFPPADRVGRITLWLNGGTGRETPS